MCGGAVTCDAGMNRLALCAEHACPGSRLPAWWSASFVGGLWNGGLLVRLLGSRMALFGDPRVRFVLSPVVWRGRWSGDLRCWRTLIPVPGACWCRCWLAALPVWLCLAATSGIITGWERCCVAGGVKRPSCRGNGTATGLRTVAQLPSADWWGTWPHDETTGGDIEDRAMHFRGRAGVLEEVPG